MVSVPPGASGGGGSASANASSRGSPAVGSGPTKAKANSNGYHPSNPQVPLSTMRSPALDLATVERRGQPNAIREPVKKKSRPHGLQEAPVFTPTEEDWRDPMEYIRKITPKARQYGICKIIPPDSWNPDFAIDTEKFHFRTRKQELNSVEGNSRANLTYTDALSKFHKQHSNTIVRLPFVDKKPLDLYRLKKAVEARGGFNRVCKHKKWAEIGRDLGYSGKIMSSLSTSLKNSYQRWLCPYEEYLRLAKPGVHQQIEAEYGGPLTPSPAATPIKRSSVNTPSSMRGDSPARQATDALQATLNGQVKEERDTPMLDAPPAPAPSTGGFRAINSGGFTAVNSGFTSVNRPAPPADDKGLATPQQFGSPISSSKNTPEFRPSGLGQSAALKRQLSCDSSDSAKKENGVDKSEGDNDNSRRSKRLKKDTVPTVVGSHMSLFRPSAPRMPRGELSVPGEQCEQCGKADEAGPLIFCESCDHSYHGTCLDPPVRQKPDTEWNCPRCLVGDSQFGFEEGGLYSLRQFQQKAADFKQGYFEKRMPLDQVNNCHRPVTEDDVETEFWRLVADLEETVEVEYGADIHCTTHGSGFPTTERQPRNPYSTDPWNLNLLPLHPESLFRHIKTDISGMTVPWVYVGMIFSTFCWHNEDHYSYSANYQHFGATKTWYGIPGEDAEKFEQAMRDAVPELFETQPDLLFQLVTLLTPEQLKKAGVRVYALDQRAGQLVITFPKAYHAGFNHGFNFNEAVNFAPADWEPFGLAGVERLQIFRRQPCFSHDELLWTAADGTTTGGLTIQTAKWLAPALERIHNRELARRKDFVAKHLEPPNRHQCILENGEEHSCPLTFTIEDEDVPEEEYQCAYCKSYCFLSRLKCLRTGKVLCLVHAGYHPCCNMLEHQRFLGEEHVLIYRKADDMLHAVLSKVQEKANTPREWEKKYEKLLEEESTPSLKVLRAILHEGDKIPFELPSLQDLKLFVDRCNEWVEEATNYTVRKQQNRRKTEKAWQSGLRKASGDFKDGKEHNTRDVSNIYRLLDEAEQIGFDCPEIQQLRERAEAIESFQEKAKELVRHQQLQSPDGIEELLEEGRTFNVDMPELDRLARILDQMKWNQKAKDKRGTIMTLEDVVELINEGRRLDIASYNDHLQHYKEQMRAGQLWEQKATELINAEIIHYPQLEALFNQVTSLLLPVSQETLSAVDQIMHKQREALRQIMDLTSRCRQPDIRKRPLYSEVSDLMDRLRDLNSKPNGTIDLQNEQKRHEDWMRRGKKLFGKTNAPLHILKSHLEYVQERNEDCFDIVHDKPRQPAEPASREESPAEGAEVAEGTDGAEGPEGDSKVHRWQDPRFREVFCLCRKVEAGLMIECEVCHEWYHSKCLKIARGKVKEEDKYTCPVCDWRVKIPRDAARPKLEDFVAWYDEIPGLPFQPEEEEIVARIIERANEFRAHIAAYCNPLVSTEAEVETQRFYLRKVEGAEILLALETNFFRQQLHKWCPVAPQPPPLTDESKSTRKPRPTKLQKMLTQYGVDDLEDLPENLKAKANSLKRKALNAAAAAAAQTNSKDLSVAYGVGGGAGMPYFGGGGGAGGSQSPTESAAGGPRDSSPHPDAMDMDAAMGLRPGSRDSGPTGLMGGHDDDDDDGGALALGADRGEAKHGATAGGGEDAVRDGGGALGDESALIDLGREAGVKVEGAGEVTAESLESERNGMDALLDGE